MNLLLVNFIEPFTKKREYMGVQMAVLKYVVINNQILNTYESSESSGLSF